MRYLFAGPLDSSKMGADGQKDWAMIWGLGFLALPPDLWW